MNATDGDEHDSNADELQGTTRCLGYSHVASRRLSSEETTALRRELRRHVFELFGLLLLPVAAPAVAAAIAVVAGLPSSVAGVVGVAAFMLGTAGAILHARDTLRRRSWTNKDLETGLAFRFDHPSRDLGGYDGGNPQGAASDALEPEHGQVFELLAASGRLWSVDGERHGRYMRWPMVRVADVPQHARIAARWVRPVPYEMSDGNGLQVGTRPLSVAERSELERHSRRVWRAGLIPAGLWGLMACAGISRQIIGEQASPILAVALFAFVVAAFRLAQGARTARALSMDMDVGMVEIFRVESEHGLLSPPIELLPASRIPWSEAGVPAPWRSAGGQTSD